MKGVCSVKWIATSPIYCTIKGKPFLLVPGDAFEVVNGMKGLVNIIWNDYLVQVSVKDLKGKYRRSHE